MSTVTENDLQEIKELIKTQNDKIEKLAEKVDNIEKSQIRLEAKIDTYKPAFDKIPDLAEKVGELKGWRAISLVIFSGFITSIYWLLRMGKL
jgi:predicted  nucleic acid-binding Zn-ribbon protein